MKILNNVEKIWKITFGIKFVNNFIKVIKL